MIVQRQSTWAAAHDATTGLEVHKTDELSNAALRAKKEFIYESVHRTFLEFDLSDVPTDRTITEATISVYVYTYGNCNAAAQEGNQSDDLELEDYNNFTGSPFCTVAMAEGPRTFTLNPAGRAYVGSKFGNKAKFCLREYDHDYLNVEPGADQSFGSGMYYSEATDEEKRPTLTLTYTT